MYISLDLLKFLLRGGLAGLGRCAHAAEIGGSNPSLATLHSKHL